MKLIATWKNWKLLHHPVQIAINGNILFDQNLFLENVCVGWPSVYFPIPLEYLQKGQNVIKIFNGAAQKNTLLINQVEILRLTDMLDFTIQSCPEFVIKNETFSVVLTLLKKHHDVKISYPKENIEFLKRKDNTFVFKAKKLKNNIAIQFRSCGKTCKGLIENVYDNNRHQRVYVGLNCDDIRHDESGEMEKVLENIAHTQIGNYIAFRHEEDRTYAKSSHPASALWRKWIKFCVDNNLFFQFSIFLPTLTMTEVKKIAGEKFLGIQLHEPYLIFQPLTEVPLPSYVKKAQNIMEKKNAYIQYLNEKCNNPEYEGLPVFFGDPSLLNVYHRDADSKGIFCEPVTNCSLLFSAARDSGKEFGSHIAGDWYFGSRHDESALKRFRMMLYLTYAYGGNYITVESTLFKTNAFTREDWEDDFCVSARSLMRSFYRFTCQDVREGKPYIPLAVIYGNLESMFWMPDEKLPELIDTDNWDDFVWGKWKETDYRWLWKAIEAWLPPFEFKDLGKDEWLTKLFAGTPYGQVGLTLPDSNLDNYKAVAFLGWNTMTNKIYGNLIKYVENGGILFICGCHLDTRIDIKQKPDIVNGGNVKKLIGADIVGKGVAVDGCHTCKLENIIAEEIEPHLFVHKLGKGTVYFFNFYDYPCDMRLVKRVQQILDKLGKEVCLDSDFAIEGKNAKYINFNLWEDGQNAKVYMTNVDWENSQSKSVTLRMKDKKYRVHIKGGDTSVVSIKGSTMKTQIRKWK